LWPDIKQGIALQYKIILTEEELLLKITNSEIQADRKRGEPSDLPTTEESSVVAAHGDAYSTKI
jgi:hypothetical protein